MPLNISIRNPILQQLVHVQEYVIGTSRYRLPMLLNKINAIEDLIEVMQLLSVAYIHELPRRGGGKKYRDPKINDHMPFHVENVDRNGQL